MKSKALMIAISAAALLLPTASFAGVTVRFVDPSRYSDASTTFAGGTDASALAEFRRHFERLGERYLAPGQNLVIDVLNINLAGDYEPWRPRFSDVRILRDVTPPRVKLRYTLSEKGRRQRSGEADLTDINYQMNASARYSNERFPYEKALLTDWFRQQFAKNAR